MGSDGFDYWESAMDICAGDDICENHRAYQTQLLEHFRVIGKEYKFTTLDANRPVHDIFADLRQHLGSILKDMRPPG